MPSTADLDPVTNPLSSSPLILVQNVSKTYGTQTVLSDVNLSVAENEVVAIIGVSGCGKSTLLKVISGLEQPDGGQVRLADPNVTMVFQYSALFDWLTVFDNVAFALRERPDDREHRGQAQPSEAEIRQTVSQTLKLVGLEGMDDKFPNQLSGGMQKRVSFARGIVSNPRIILYDEPTAGLDPIASTVVEDMILTVRDQLHTASIVVTHQMSTILRTATRVCLLHDGAVAWEGTPDTLMTTDHPLAAQFAHAKREGPLNPLNAQHNH